MMSAVVGVDIGTGAARAVAIDREGAIQGHASTPYADRQRWETGHADPRSWQAATFATLEALAAERPGLFPAAALAVGGQSPAVVASGGGDALTLLHPGATDTDPHEAHHRLWAHLAPAHAGAEPLQAWDWILHALGAPRAQGRWPGTPLLDGFGPYEETGTVVAMASGSCAAVAGTPLAPAGPDAYMAFWAAGIDRPGRGLDPGGRTGGLGVATPARSEDPPAYGLRSAVADVDILGGPVTAHGLAAEWWCRMTGRSIDDLLEAAAAVPPGAGGVLLLPYFEGERAPRWNRALRAELAGMDTATTAGGVMRAVVEGSAFGLRHIADTLAKEGVLLRRLVVAGSQARSPLWCQVKADVLGVPVEVPAYPDLAAYGAALAAGAAAGWWPRPGQGAPGDWPVPSCSVLDPRPDPRYEEAYTRWLQLGDDAERRAAADLLTAPPTERRAEDD